MVTVRNKFNTHPEISETYTPNKEYENIVTNHIEAATSKPRVKCRVPGESLIVWKKWDNLKKNPYLKERNSKNSNMQRLKKPRKN